MNGASCVLEPSLSCDVELVHGARCVYGVRDRSFAHRLSHQAFFAVGRSQVTREPEGCGGVEVEFQGVSSPIEMFSSNSAIISMISEDLGSFFAAREIRHRRFTSSKGVSHYYSLYG